MPFIELRDASLRALLTSSVVTDLDDSKTKSTAETLGVGTLMRVPTPNVSAVDFVFESSKSVTTEEVNNALKEASLSSMKGIIKYGDEPLVSSDYAGTNESSIVDSDLTMCIGDNLVKVLACKHLYKVISNTHSEVTIHNR